MPIKQGYTQHQWIYSVKEFSFGMMITFVHYVMANM